MARPRVRGLSRETRRKIAEGAEAVADKAEPEPKSDKKSEKKAAGK
jgi:hypothetical protein